MRRLRVADVAADVPDGVVDVAVDDDEIERAVEIEVGEETAESEPVPRRGPDARAGRDVLIETRLLRAIEPDHLAFEVRDRHARPAGVVEVRRVDAHAGAGLAVFAERHARLERHVLERAVPQVAIQLVRLRVVGHEDVGPAVLIVIEQRDAERLRARVEDAARGGDVLERAVAAVAEQPAGLTPIGFGRAVGLLLAVEAAEHVVLRRPPHVVADEQIEEAVAIEVDPHRRRAEGLRVRRGRSRA